MAEGKSSLAQVVGLIDIDHGEVMGFGIRVGSVQDRVHRRPRWRRPAAKDARTLEGIAGERPEPDHASNP